jgi:hypothetical protein
MTTFDYVLQLARQLPPPDQARLRAALSEEDEQARVAQIARNQPAIALLDSWLSTNEEDDGTESWDDMLRALDAHRESYRTLFPHLHTSSVGTPE